MSLEGKKCPAFSGDATGGTVLSNKDFEGKNFVIFFYPKDNTPGCTLEGQDFRDNHKKFLKLDTEIVGVSRDSIKSHENFISCLLYTSPSPRDTPISRMPSSA